MSRLVSLVLSPAIAALVVIAGHAPAHADTTIAGGNIINQTWTTAGSPYVLQGDITVPAGAFLRIEPGVEVRAMANVDGQMSGANTSRIEIIVEGTLDATGTAASPVVFKASSTSTGAWYGVVARPGATQVKLSYATIQHSIYGVVSDAPGTVLQLERSTIGPVSSYGVWLRAGSPTVRGVEVFNTGEYGVHVSNSASPTLVDTVLRNTGYGVYVAHNTPGHTVAIDNVTIDNCEPFGIYTAASSANGAAINVTDSIITTSGYGIYRADSAAISVTHSNIWNNINGDLRNVVTGTGVISSNPLYVSATDLRLTSNSPSRFGAGNGADQGARPYDTVATPGLYGVLWSNTTLTAAGSPYTAAGDLTVAPNVALTLEPGVRVQFTANADIMKSGENTARGELTVRGRLVADGTPAAPITLGSTSTALGSWFGLVLDTTARDVVLDHLVIDRANHGLTYRSTGANNQLTNLTVQSSLNYGIWLRTGTPSINGFSIVNAGGYGVHVSDSSSPSLSNGTILNANYGVYVAHNQLGHTVAIDNVTIDNSEPFGIYTAASGSNGASIDVTDSIITTSGYGIYRADSAAISVTHSNIWNNINGDLRNVVTGTGVISSNPLYVSASDLRLTSNSPSRFGAGNGADQGGRPYDTVATPGLHGVLWSNTTLTAAGGPYPVAGDLTVAPNVTLTIEPGATLQFTANADVMKSGENTARGELIVRGRLVADGTPTTPITFGSTSTSLGSWYGLLLDATARDVVLDNVVITRANHGLTYRSTATTNQLSRLSILSTLNYGMWLRAGAPKINGFSIVNAGGYGVHVSDTSSPTLLNGVMLNANYGVYVAHNEPGHTVDVVNCTIESSEPFAIYTAASGSNGAAVTVTNSILTNSGYGVYRADSAAVAVRYSDVWNNINGNYRNVTPGAGTISSNPLYVSATDLHLQSTSVAIDAGTTGPTTDAEGITRPLDGNGIGGAQWDMGAYEFVLAAVCGNGAIEPGEACDSGASNGMYGHCNANCTGLGPRCGDGITNGPETCDDANTSNTDACLDSCVVATCGDAYVRAGVEQCDDGNDSNTDACLNSCDAARCGDGFTQAGVEQCDDGNTSNTDACLTSCEPASCGDGFVQAGVEDCDDQNDSNTDACLNTCDAARCGDGFTQAGVEECDDGNDIATDACTAVCEHATCGDGVVQTGVEQCDDGNDVDTDQCSNACERTRCGDGVVQEPEECDDGNDIDTDACRYDCTDAACGDGVVRAGVEQCDDGNVMAGDGCSPACMVETGEPNDPDPPGGDGCCQTSGHANGGLVLAALVAIVLRRRRRPAR